MVQLLSDMPPIKAPNNLPELVRTAFHRARKNGDLQYYPTQVALLDVNSVPFQLRFSPALANKPKAAPAVAPVPKDDPSAPSPPKRVPFNPFENPAPGLLVAQLPPHHALVLNKFAIVPEHFILITKTFKQQTYLLEAEDLAATLACIEAYHERRDEVGEPEGEGEGGGEGGSSSSSSSRYGELFAFFNSGEHSGASQPHRHVQLLPVERMRDGLEGEGEGGKGAWEVLANRLVGGGARQVPFRTFAERIRPGTGAEELHRLYLGLYRRACATVARVGEGVVDGGGGGGEEEQRDGEARISYNMAMTRDAIVILPRLAEGVAITGGDGDGEVEGGKVVGKLALNGTVLAGTALVKSQAEWDLLRARPEMVVDLLGKIGVSPSQSKV